MRTIAIANQKGGIGKSTTAAALATGLSARGFRTLAVDLDPQGSLTYIMGADGEPPTTYNLLRREATATEIIRAAPQGDLIPGNTSLSSADIEFMSTGKEHLLREGLSPLEGSYDYIILDTPPTLGILTVNAFTAADSIIIPTGADVLSIQGIGQLYQTVNLVKTYCNPYVNMKGILLTRHNTRTVLSRDFQQTIHDMAEQLGTFVYDTSIRDGIVIKEAQARHESLYEYAPKASPVQDYSAFVDEFLRREQDG